MYWIAKSSELVHEIKLSSSLPLRNHRRCKLSIWAVLFRFMVSRFEKISSVEELQFQWADSESTHLSFVFPSEWGRRHEKGNKEYYPGLSPIPLSAWGLNWSWFDSSGPSLKQVSSMASVRMSIMRSVGFYDYCQSITNNEARLASEKCNVAVLRVRWTTNRWAAWLLVAAWSWEKEDSAVEWVRANLIADTLPPLPRTLRGGYSILQ